MSHSDRREYLTATVLDQALLDRLQDNLDFKLEMTADIVLGATPSTDTAYVSDRNKYKGGRYYRKRISFPTIERSMGEWLDPQIEFSVFATAISNVDGIYNRYLPGGANFAGLINRNVTVQLGLRDVASTYFTIFKGSLTPIAGYGRTRSEININARDQFEAVNNKKFPGFVFTTTNYADIEDTYVGQRVPVIYGDFTIDLPNPYAVVPAFPVNGANAGVLAGTTSVQAVISENDNVSLDTANCYLFKNDTFYLFNAGDISVFGAGNKAIEVKQSGTGGTTLIDGNPYTFEAGDLFYIRMKGKDLGAYDDNIVWQARDILINYGDVLAGDLDTASWEAFRDKASPAESAISTYKSRVWTQDEQATMQYVLSMLEQVRLECFIDKNLKFKLSSLHFDAFPTPGAYVIRNWDIIGDSFQPELDDRNVWNRANAAYGYDPFRKEEAFLTPIFENAAAITQMGREISRTVTFPNLYQEATVILQLKEMIKLASSAPEFINVHLSLRSALKDLGDFVTLNVSLSSSEYVNVPTMIRRIGYDPTGKIVARLWSFQQTPYPNYTPGYAGTVGGYSATITQAA